MSNMFGRGKSLLNDTVSRFPNRELYLSGIQRPVVKGKFLFLGDQKLYIKGVTYGTFRPGHDGLPFPDPEVVARDFKMMVESGINALRTYTVPPRWLLNLAWENNLWVMVGLPWEQHITFLDDRRRVQRIED